MRTGNISKRVQERRVQRKTSASISDVGGVGAHEFDARVDSSLMRL